MVMVVYSECLSAVPGVLAEYPAMPLLCVIVDLGITELLCLPEVPVYQTRVLLLSFIRGIYIGLLCQSDDVCRLSSSFGGGAFVISPE